MAGMRWYLRAFNRFASQKKSRTTEAPYKPRSIRRTFITDTDIDMKENSRNILLFILPVYLIHSEGVVPLESDTTYDSPEEESPSCGKDYEVGRVSTFL